MPSLQWHAGRFSPSLSFCPLFQCSFSRAFLFHFPDSSRFAVRSRKSVHTNGPWISRRKNVPGWGASLRKGSLQRVSEPGKGPPCPAPETRERWWGGGWLQDVAAPSESAETLFSSLNAYGAPVNVAGWNFPKLDPSISFRNSS